MLIERTIRVDGRTVTVTHRVDTGGKVTTRTESTTLQEEKVAFGAELGRSHKEALESLRPAEDTKKSPKPAGEPERPDPGGEAELPDPGGSGAGGITIVFGPVTVNCGSSSEPPGGGEGELPDPVGADGDD